jgi:trypsin
MKRFSRMAILVMALSLLAIMIVPAAAITNGEVAGDDHPEVVLILMEVADAPAFRCSGTMIGPTTVLTAGHCTNGFPESDFSGMRVFYESDVDQGTADGTNNYPFAGPNSIEAVRWASHPLYETAPFFFNDVGLIELESAVPGLDSSDYGVLPEANQLDSLATRRGLRNTSFTAVGYGLQEINPVFITAERVRMVAEPKLIQINVPGFTGDFSLLLSNNHSTGGTCFGDSGGPNFLGDSQIVAGVTSFGINGNCAGTGGVFRLDRQNVLDFVADFRTP